MPPPSSFGGSLPWMKRIEMLGRIILFKLLFIIRVREAFRVTPAVTKVDSLLRVASAMRIFQKYFDKNRDCSASCGQICSKTVPGGLWYVPVRMVCSRGPGKFCSPRLTGLKVLKMCSILEKVALARWFPYFSHFVDFDEPWMLRMEKRSSGMYIRGDRVSESVQEWL